jgi:hypothetical protein
LAVESDQPMFRKKLGEIIKDNLQFSVFEYKFETFDKRVIWAECRVSYRNKTLFKYQRCIAAKKLPGAVD